MFQATPALFDFPTFDVTPATVLGISGSLRAGSLNTLLLRAAAELALPDCSIDVYRGLAGIPPYNEDDDEDPPPEVAELRSRIARADGLLVACPEYNYSVPGVLKNALDWASRPFGSSALFRKPVAIMGAAPGNFGTVRAELALRDVFLWTDSRVLAEPEVHVFRAGEHFDAEGRPDESTAAHLKGLIVAFAGLMAAGRRLPVGT